MDCKCPSRNKEKCEHVNTKGFCPLLARIEKLETVLNKTADAGSLALVHIFNITDVDLAMRIHDELEPALKKAEEVLDGAPITA